jgi:hypothetical protein
MTFDSTSSAYGLVQVVFADVTDRLATAVFVFQQRRDPNVTFGEIYELQFKRLLKAFKNELKQFGGQPSVADDLRAIQEVCQELGNLSAWRNDRIHARVREVDGKLALYDWRTGERLTISYEECVEIIDRLARVIATLQGHMPALVSNLDFDKEWNTFFGDLEAAQENE